MPLVNLNLRFDLPEEQPIVVYDRNDDEELIAYLQKQHIAILILRILREREEYEISRDTG